MKDSAPPRRCSCCQAAAKLRLAPRRLPCQRCAHEGAALPSLVDEAKAQHRLSGIQRSQALWPLRQGQGAQLPSSISEDLVAHVGAGGGPQRLLDVGAGQGWFAQSVERFAAPPLDFTGIEPDEGARPLAQERGGQLRAGFSPQCLGREEKSEFIVFYDRFEHLSQPPHVLQASGEHEQGAGLIALTLLAATGALHRLVRMTMRLKLRLKVRGAYERMRQVGLPSPSLHYLKSDLLTRLDSEQGLAVVRCPWGGNLRYKGLYQPVAYATEQGRWATALNRLLSAPRGGTAAGVAQLRPGGDAAQKGRTTLVLPFVFE